MGADFTLHRGGGTKNFPMVTSLKIVSFLKNYSVPNSLFMTEEILYSSVPTDRRSFRTSPKKILDDRSIQDLKIAKRTSKDLFFDPGTVIRFFKMASL